MIGRPDVAEAGQLRTFVAGDPAVIAKCDTLLRAYCQMVVNVGEKHQVANSLKLAVNYMGVSLIELMGEVYGFGEKSGISPDMLNLVMGAFFGQPALQEYARLIHGRNFTDPGFALSGAMKDMELMMQAAGDIRAPLPFGSIVRDKLLTAAARGMEDLDWAAISEISRIQAGLA